MDGHLGARDKPFAFEDGSQARLLLIAGHAVAGLDIVQHGPQSVDARKQRIHDGHRDGQLAVPHQHQHAFHDMAEALQGFKGQEARAPLDAVDRAEDAIDDFLGKLIPALLHRQQIGFDGIEVFAAFSHEIRDDAFIDNAAHGSPPAKGSARRMGCAGTRPVSRSVSQSLMTRSPRSGRISED